MAQPSLGMTDQEALDFLNNNNFISNTTNTAGTGILDGLLGGVSDFLGGTGGQLLGTGLGLSLIHI